jgi:hypothetical protein
MNKIYSKGALRYWAFWPSTLFTILVFLIFIIAQNIGFVFGVLAKVKASEGEISEFKYELGKLVINGKVREVAEMLDGTILSISTLTSSIICGLLIILIIKLKKGSDLVEYLHLRIPKPKQLLFWSTIAFVLVLITELLTRNLDIFSTPVMDQAFNNMENPLLFFTSVVFLTPIFEEIFYRGFIFKHLENSKIGGIGAALVTTLLFTFSHIQYELSILITVVPLALVLGFSRLFTSSLIVPITIHMLINILSFLFMALDI